VKQVLQYPHKSGLTLADCPTPGCKPQGVVVNNRYSLISAGTERAIMDMASQNLIGKARSRPDLVRQVLGKIRSEGLFATIDKVRARLETPIPLGYSCAGIVAQVGEGVHDLSVGDRAACAGFGYASHAEQVFVPQNLTVTIPTNVSFEEGAFTTLGAIALWGVRQSKAALGETVVVIGLGLLGQLTLQILKAAGCRVAAVDIDAQRLDEAARFGADLLVNLNDAHATQAVWQFTDGRGADAAIITAATASNQPIAFAADTCRDRGQVTVVGNVGMAAPRKAFYDKELTLNIARSYGPGRYDRSYEECGQDYPLGFVRWTERRNMQAFLELVSQGKVDVKSLITAAYDIDHIEEAYQRIAAQSVLGVLLHYPQSDSARTPAIAKSTHSISRGDVRIGFLGAGSFATGVLLPALKRQHGCRLTTIYSPTPHKARFAADRFGFASVANSEQEVMSHSDVDLLFIATPHHCHAEQVLSALQAGKGVFVEKPLCLTGAEWQDLKETYDKHLSPLIVGFNRRYSVCTERIKAVLAARQAPLMFNYTVNAPFIPANTWLQDDKLGGGRIIGEVCHFIDFITHITNATVTIVKTTSISQVKRSYLADDNVVIHLTLSDGSAGTITYTTLGSAPYPKETLQIFSDGAVLHLSDFKLLQIYRGGKRKTLYDGAMDKGFAAELSHVLDVCRSGQPSSEVESYFHSSLAAILTRRSLRTGRTINVIEEPIADVEADADPLH
jgi:predicted dehydrogenase/D-arabinose 1-dehydrogenase-like Zn-dependent alcohol dehydrogenase